MEIIPFLCFLLMIGIFAGSWRERFLLASVSWGVIVLIVTELLSAWHGLDRFGLAIAWSIILIILGSRTWIVKPRLLPFSFHFHLKSAAIVLMVSGILLVTAVIAFYAAPNNWDSMTYHLARVAHWAQDKTVAMFPTANLRQINYPPWSSYAITQFYILAHNDRWANFNQWFSSLGSMVGVSLIVARLKGGVQLQALAALIVATIPMGILQSTSTQNDYVVAFWLVCFVYFGLSFLQDNRWLYSLAAGASLGLAWLVKGIGYIDAMPFLIWIIVGGIKAHGRRSWARIATMVLIALLLNSPYYVRNFSLTGTISPPSESSNMVGEKMNAKVVIANFVLNLGLHGATVWDGPNRLVENAVGRVHQWLGISEGDKRVCMSPGTTFQLLDRTFRYHEDYAGNLIHTLLIICCLWASLFWWRRLSIDTRCYTFALLGSILLFVIMIKWSPFHSRYHLPMFVLFAPFLSIVLGCCFRSWGIIIVAVILTVAALPWVSGNKTRPLFGPRSVLTVPRVEQYFFNNAGYVPYVYALGAAAQVNCKQIGLVFDGDTWEYPLTAVSQWQKREDMRFEHIFVDNMSAKLPYPLGNFTPCMIIKKDDAGPAALNWQGNSFMKIDQRGFVATYLRAN